MRGLFLGRGVKMRGLAMQPLPPHRISLAKTQLRMAIRVLSNFESGRFSVNYWAGFWFHNRPVA